MAAEKPNAESKQLLDPHLPMHRCQLSESVLEGSETPPLCQ